MKSFLVGIICTLPSFAIAAPPDMHVVSCSQKGGLYAYSQTEHKDTVLGTDYALKYPTLFTTTGTKTYNFPLSNPTADASSNNLLVTSVGTGTAATTVTTDRCYSSLWLADYSHAFDDDTYALTRSNGTARAESEVQIDEDAGVVEIQFLLAAVTQYTDTPDCSIVFFASFGEDQYIRAEWSDGLWDVTGQYYASSWDAQYESLTTINDVVSSEFSLTITAYQEVAASETVDLATGVCPNTGWMTDGIRREVWDDWQSEENDVIDCGASVQIVGFEEN